MWCAPLAQNCHNEMIFGYSNEPPRRVVNRVVVNRVIQTNVGLSLRVGKRLLRRSAPRNDSYLRRHCERSDATLALHAGPKRQTFTARSLFLLAVFRCFGFCFSLLFRQAIGKKPRVSAAMANALAVF